MNDIEGGILISAKGEQFLKALNPMNFKDDGIFIL